MDGCQVKRVARGRRASKPTALQGYLMRGFVTPDFSLRSLPDPNGKGLKFTGRSDAHGEVLDGWDFRNPGLLGLLSQRGRSKSEIQVAEPLQCLSEDVG